MKLYDQSGQEVDVPDEHAGAALASGTYGLPQGSHVPVQLEDGSIGTVPVESIQDTLSQGGAVIPQQQYDEHVLQRDYGGAAGMATAAVGGALGGASLGATDAAVGGLAPKGVSEYLKKSYEANPVTHALGEVAGGIGVGLATGGAGEVAEAGELANAANTLAHGADGAISAASHLTDVAHAVGSAPLRALTAPMRGLTEVGGLVERGVSKLVGSEAKSLAGRIGQKAATLAARGTIEGAVMGGGDEIGEESLGDPELNGQKILAAVGHGALLGLGGGAVLGAGGELGSAALGRLSTKLSGAAEEQAFRSLSVSSDLKNVRQAEKIPGGMRGVGRRLLDEGVVTAGEDVESLAPKVAAAKESAGKRVGDLLDQADQAGFAGPKLSDVFTKIDDEVLPRLQELPSLNRGVIDKVAALKGDLESIVGLRSESEALAEARQRAEEMYTSGEHGGDFQAVLKREQQVALTARQTQKDAAQFGFKQAQNVRARIDDAINWAATAPGVTNETQEALKGIRGVIEREIETAGDAAAKKLGTSFLDEYKDAKLAYRQMAVANDISEKAVAKMAANRKLSPTDYIAGHGGLAFAGGHAAHTAVSPLTGIATAVAHHYIRERGNSVAAVALDKLSAFGAVQRATAQVDREIDRGVARALGRTDRVPPRTKGVEGDFDSKRAAIIKAASNPDAHADEVESAVGPLTAHAPQVAGAFQRAALKATTYLAKALPGSPAPPLAVKTHHADVSDVDKEKWEALYDVVHDPATALQNLSDGTLTSEQVDALKSTHPELYAETKQKLAAELASHGEDLSLEQMTSIGTFMGQPVDSITGPTFLGFVQSNYAAGGGSKRPPSGSHGGAPKRKIDLVNPYKLAGSGSKEI